MPADLTLTPPHTPGRDGLEPAIAPPARTPPPKRRRGGDDPAWVRWSLTGLVVLVLTVLVIVPVLRVFHQGLAGGVGAYLHTLIDDADNRNAILLTLIVAPVAVLMNVVFGVAAAWAIGRFRFPGRTLLITLIDLPFSVSPVVAGLAFVLLFGLQGYFGKTLQDLNIKVLFALPSLILVTAFVTFPFVARELLPVLEAIGPDEDLAAISLGANGWQMFRRVTLPNIKWGVLYGVILCNARAMGEFGAVYVVSGRTEGHNDTVPLRVHRLIEDLGSGSYTAAFALATVLTSVALLTLVLKVWLERRVHSKDEL